MSEKKGLLSTGLGMVLRNKRYILWFWLLNLTLAEFGTSAFRQSAHAILDQSLASQRLVHGFDLSVMIELFSRPEFGPMAAAQFPAFCFAVVFLLATALFLPGVFQGYASTYRLPREDFFRTCGRNLWRYIRLMLVAGVVMGITTGGLFALHGLLERKAGESTNELLLPEVRFMGLFVIFLIMTVFRIWFDLAEVDIVLSDQCAVRKSLAAGFRHTFHGFVRLLGSYVVAALVGTIVLAGGIWMWMKLVSPGKRSRGVHRCPTHIAFASDSSLLAAGSRCVILAATHARTACSDCTYRSSARSGRGRGPDDAACARRSVVSRVSETSQKLGSARRWLPLFGLGPGRISERNACPSL